MLLLLRYKRRRKIGREQLTKDVVYDLYVNQGYSTRDVAEVFGVGQTTIRRFMKKVNIQARHPHEKTDHYHQKMKPIYERYKEENSKHMKNVCLNCGNEFDVTYLDKYRKYCSDTCRKEAITIVPNEYYCTMCGDKIINVNGKNYERRFCPECLPKHRSETQTKRIIRNCGYCGKELSVIPTRAKAKYVYCNIECMGKHYSEIHTGENNPTWKGGKKHYQGNWLAARNIVRERDFYTCQICGITEIEYGKQMSVHHIKNYREYKNKIWANKPNNLICLCAECHTFVHSKANINKIYIKKKRKLKVA